MLIRRFAMGSLSSRLLRRRQPLLLARLLASNRKSPVKPGLGGEPATANRLKPENPVITGEPSHVRDAFDSDGVYSARGPCGARPSGSEPGVGRDAARKNFPAKEFCLAGELVAVTVFLLLESDTFSPPRNIRQPSGVRVNRRPIFLSVQGGREKG